MGYPLYLLLSELTIAPIIDSIQYLTKEMDYINVNGIKEINIDLQHTIATHSYPKTVS